MLFNNSHSVQYKTPSDRGLYNVASQVHSAEDQRILVETLGVTLWRQQRNPLFNALKRWRDGDGGKDHPPTWRCLLDAISQTSGVDPHVVRDLEEKASYLTEFSLGEYNSCASFFGTVLKSGPVETIPTRPVATGLCMVWDRCVNMYIQVCTHPDILQLLQRH